MRGASDAEPSREAEAPAVDVSVVVPVYNAAETLEPLVERLGEVFRGLGRSWEVLLTDDGSRDESWAVIERLHARGEPIRAFRLRRNHGQHYALKCGLDHCRGRYAVTMDDDLQHPPEEIPKLLAALEADPEADVVIGRYDRKRHSVFRNFGSWSHNRAQQVIFAQDRRVTLGPFRIMRGEVVEEIRRTRHARPRIGPLILSITSRVRNVEVHHAPRAAGRSGYTLRRLVGDTLDAILSYSSLPLRLVSALGLGSAGISAILALYFLVAYLVGYTQVSGFTSLILAVLFTGGVILFSIGLVGEYLERIMAQAMLSAQYHIRTELPLRAPLAAAPEMPVAREG